MFKVPLPVLVKNGKRILIPELSSTLLKLAGDSLSVWECSESLSDSLCMSLNCAELLCTQGSVILASHSLNWSLALFFSELNFSEFPVMSGSSLRCARSHTSLCTCQGTLLNINYTSQNCCSIYDIVLASSFLLLILHLPPPAPSPSSPRFLPSPASPSHLKHFWSLADVTADNTYWGATLIEFLVLQVPLCFGSFY